MPDYQSNDYTEELERLLAEAVEDSKPVSTGIPALDSLLGGGLHKGLSVLAGDTGAGKTSLAIQAALYIANQSSRGIVAYDLCDMNGRRTALLRMVSTAAAVAGAEGFELGSAGTWDDQKQSEGLVIFQRVSGGRVRLHETADVAELIETIDNAEEKRLARIEFQQKLRSVDRDSPEDMEALKAKRDRLNELSRPTRMLVCDFAQAMEYNSRSLAFDTEAASLAVRELRAWAYSHDAVVLLLSAYNKDAGKAHERGAEPRLSDILGSAELAYSAEHVLALVNPHDGSGKITVRDLKHRHAGNTAQANRVCTLHLDAEHGLFG